MRSFSSSINLLDYIKSCSVKNATAQNWSCPDNGSAITSIITQRTINQSSNENLFQWIEYNVGLL